MVAAEIVRLSVGEPLVDVAGGGAPRAARAGEGMRDAAAGGSGERADVVIDRSSPQSGCRIVLPLDSR